MEKKKTKTKTNSGAMELVLVGASLAGIAATAYFFLGPKAKQHQKNAKAWMIKMKGDVVEKLERAGDVSEPVYREIIDSVAKEYVKGKKAGNKEIAALAADLKKHWKTVSGGAKTAKKDLAKSVKRATKKASQK